MRKDVSFLFALKQNVGHEKKSREAKTGSVCLAKTYKKG
jgi:hypothetical protein